MSEDRIVKLKRRENITIDCYLEDHWEENRSESGEVEAVRHWKVYGALRNALFGQRRAAIVIKGFDESTASIAIYDCGRRLVSLTKHSGFDKIAQAEKIFMKWVLEMSGTVKEASVSEKLTIDDYLSRLWETLENGTQSMCRTPVNPTDCIKRWKNGSVAITVKKTFGVERVFDIRWYDASGRMANSAQYYGESPIEEAERLFMDWTLTATGIPKPAEETPGRKDHEGKMPWHLLPWKECEEIVKVLRFGAKKYSENNWMKVKNPKDMYFRALVSHVSEWRKGNTHDEESGLHHLAHAACNCLFLMWFDGFDSQGKE